MLYDVIVVGSGVAGLRAALEVNRQGLKVGVIVKTNPLRSNSSMASGGINSAINLGEDGVLKHIDDTLKSSLGLGNLKVIQKMCKAGVKAIEELEYLGVNFDKDSSGKISQRAFGGAGEKRTCYVQDRTGSAIVQTLIMRARERGIECLKDYYFMNIIKDSDNKLTGITALRKSDSNVVVFATKSLILAGGGFGGIYRGYSTNPQDTNGDILASSLRAGLRVRDIEFVQFHPTGLKRSGSLISEAARGEGGYLVNSDGERFVDELQRRDIVAKAIAEQIQNSKDVFLDLRHLSEELINSKLPSLRKIAINAEGVDPVSELIPIKPVAHYTIGGVETNLNTSTDIKGVFVAGEASSNLAHGANRLGGNSLLEAVVFGEIAGREASKFASKSEFSPIDYKIVDRDAKLVEHILNGENRYNINSLRKSLGNTLNRKVGIFKDENSLVDAFEYIEYISTLTSGLHCINKDKKDNFELVAILEFRNAILVAEALILASLKREESRGSFNRDDFRDRDDENFQRHSYVEYKNRSLLSVDFEDKRGNFLKDTLSRFRKFLKN